MHALPDAAPRTVGIHSSAAAGLDALPSAGGEQGEGEGEEGAGEASGDGLGVDGEIQNLLYVNSRLDAQILETQAQFALLVTRVGFEPTRPHPCNPEPSLTVDEGQEGFEPTRPHPCRSEPSPWCT